MDNNKDNTPRHCWDCDKFQTCEQAQFMVASTKPVDAYMGDAEFVCQDCAGDGAQYIGEESDVPEHCGICHRPLECSLTQDGVEYLKENMDGGCCQELWPVLYAAYL